MRALILNSGLGSRMGDITSTHPKCMTEISFDETIISRQLRLLRECGIKNIIITTGYLNETLVKYCNELGQDLNIQYINNAKYNETNAIYSIYCARDYLHDDIIMMHGDLVFTLGILKKVIEEEKSVMVVSSTIPLPEKDFKGLICDGRITKIGVDCFQDSLTAQPLYKIKKDDWEYWLNSIISFCESDNVKCYAENAFNAVSDKCLLYPLDVKEELCSEIDNQEDLELIKSKLKQYKLGGNR